MSKKCLNCDKILEGRKGKKYCDDYCKSNYHYQKTKENSDTLFLRIDKQLKLNRKLLFRFNQAGKSTIRKEKLLNEGFNPRLFTHYWKNKKGQVYFFCYDFGFLEVKEKELTKYVLVEYQDYMGVL